MTDSAEMRYRIADLSAFAEALFSAAGLAPELAAAVAWNLTRADAMGHTTHGLALASWYLGDVLDGAMTPKGDPEVISDTGPAVCWHGRRLPGAWLVDAAMDLAIDRAQTYGTCTIAVGDAHHIGALAVYLERATDKGLMAMIASSSPSGAQVAPYGGLTGLFNPQPVAYGIPTDGAPVLIDISAGITTANMAKRLVEEGREYDRDCLMDKTGTPTRDPRVLGQGGTILPIGGLDYGQKGYGLSLSLEALSQGLAGVGRADAPTGTNSAFTVQVLDPEAFGGLDAFTRQTGWLAAACRATTPHPDFDEVRLPGEAALARRRDAETNGLALYPTIMPQLEARAGELGVPLPEPLP